MSIIANDLAAFLSAQVSDDDPAANGGPPADAPMSLSAKNNGYRDLTIAQRSSGDRRWRKIFLANLNAQGLEGESPLVVMDNPTAYGDYCFFVPGAAANYESDLTGDEPMYGAALLGADAAAGATVITLALEDEALAPMLAVGRELLISDRVGFENTTGTQGSEELREIAAVTVSGTTATVTLTNALGRDFAVEAGARASVVYRPPAIPAGRENATPIWVSNVIPAGTTEYGLTDLGIGWQVESPV